MGRSFQWVDGTIIKVNLLQSDYPIKDEGACRSNAQYRFGQRLMVLFGGEVILEDFIIPHSGLSLDFFMPRFNVAFEIQGRQHDYFIPFMHGDRLSFKKQKERDLRKMEWCELNGIKLLYVKDTGVDEADILELMN